MSTQADRSAGIAGARGRLVVPRHVRALGGVTAVVVLVVIVGSAIAAASLLLDAVAGIHTFVTHPVSVVAQAGAAVGVALLGGRRGLVGDRSGSRWMLALAVALMGYLDLGALATKSVDPVAVGLWSVWWAVPTTVVQLAAKDAAGIRRRWTVGAGALAVVVIALAAVLADPVEPFAGVAPAAPEAWRSGPLLDALVGAQMLVAVAIPVVLIARAVRVMRAPAARPSPSPRSTAVLIAAAASVPPLLVVICLGLAIARDPGAVEPAVGSVGYLVALSTGCVLAAACLAAVRPAASAAVVTRLIAGVLGGYALVGLLLAAIALGAAAWPAGSGAVAVVVIAATALAAGAWWFGWRRLVAAIAGHEPTVETASRLTMLSPRESEVLALLADGARDTEIATRLHLSERTIESHLNRIFAKLGLDAAEGRNRRILAVRAWAESGAPTPAQTGLREKPDTAAGPVGRA